MSKVKVLVISIDNHGVGYYRINAPFLSLKDEDVEIKFFSSSDFTALSFWIKVAMLAGIISMSFFYFLF